MINKYAAPKCKTGYTSSTDKLSSFRFPLKNEELNRKWIRSVNRSDWVLQNTQFFLRVTIPISLKK